MQSILFLFLFVCEVHRASMSLIDFSLTAHRQLKDLIDNSQISIGTAPAQVARVRTLPTFGNLTWDPLKIVALSINSLQLGPYHLFNLGGVPADIIALLCDYCKIVI